MSGKPTKLNTLEARKQLLLVESELNRAQLINEIRELKNTIGHIKEQTQSIGAIASSAAKMATTLLAVRRFFSPKKENSGKSWVGTVLKGAQFCASLLGSRSR